jgi:hypothetical protein
MKLRCAYQSDRTSLYRSPKHGGIIKRSIPRTVKGVLRFITTLVAKMKVSNSFLGHTAILISCLALSTTAIPKGLPLKRLHARQQSNTFNPDPASGLDDPTIQIADPSFATAIKAGYQGPMASYEDHALVGPVDLLRSGMVNFGVTPNFTLPLYSGKSANGTQYWWIVTDSSDEGTNE